MRKQLKKKENCRSSKLPWTSRIDPFKTKYTEIILTWHERNSPKDSVTRGLVSLS